jgi:hypothetical protein
MCGIDVKLMLGVGFFCGAEAEQVLLSIFIVLFLVSIVDLIFILFKKKCIFHLDIFLSLPSFAVVFIPKSIQLLDMFFVGN